MLGPRHTLRITWGRPNPGKCWHLEIRMGAGLGKLWSFRKWRERMWAHSDPITIVLKLSYWRPHYETQTFLGRVQVAPLLSSPPASIASRPKVTPGEKGAPVSVHACPHLRKCTAGSPTCSLPVLLLGGGEPVRFCHLAAPRLGDWYQDPLTVGNSRHSKRCSLTSSFFCSRVSRLGGQKCPLQTSVLMTSFWISIIFLT